MHTLRSILHDGGLNLFPLALHPLVPEKSLVNLLTVQAIISWADVFTNEACLLALGATTWTPWRSCDVVGVKLAKEITGKKVDQRADCSTT